MILPRGLMGHQIFPQDADTGFQYCFENDIYILFVPSFDFRWGVKILGVKILDLSKV